MKLSAIARYRLYNQQIARQSFGCAGEIVSWMGAMQAQDYAGAKWSIGLRLPGSTDAGIEQAIADKELIRTWGLRGTLHWMPTADVHWMLKSIAPRIHVKCAAYLRRDSLDKATVNKSNNILVKALRDGQALTREELGDILKKKGIATSNIGLGHLLLHASIERLICLGPRRGKQFTHVLMDDWVPEKLRHDPADALAELTLRYFRSHGPATIKDFMWWAGITLTEAKRGVEKVNDQLEELVVDGATYFFVGDLPSLKSKSPVQLLPGFDEFLLGYTDRSAMIEKKHAHKIAMSANGQFSSTIVINGQVGGIWKRTTENKEVVFEMEYFTEAGKSVQQAVDVAARRFAKFMGLKAVL